MNARPSGPELLAAARDALAADLLPQLAGEARYAALMIGNAIGIALRELERDEAVGAAELDRIRALIGAGAPAMLAEANRRLAQAIRDGAFAGPARGDALLAHLRATTRERLAISNPKALEERAP
jgi:hypothetical protein